MLLPMLTGVRTFLYPSPLHYRIVPELAYDTNATILFGTDTFLAGYAARGQPLRFLRAALRLRRRRARCATRRGALWAEKFGLRILEGYGATETRAGASPSTRRCISRPAPSAGFLPGIEHRLEPVPGIDEGGRLCVRGPNVMVGYLRVERAGRARAAEGRLVRHRRHRRASTTRASSPSAAAPSASPRSPARWCRWPPSRTSRPPVARRAGTRSSPCPTRARASARPGHRPRGARRAPSSSRTPARAACPSCSCRATSSHVDALPLLGTGKTDYPAVKAMAEQSASSAPAPNETDA